MTQTASGRPTYRRERRRPDEADRGSSTIEAVIIMPAVIVLTLLLVQAVLVWHGRHVAQAAAQTAAVTGAGYRADPGQGDQACAEYLHAVAPHLLAGGTCRVERHGSQMIATVDATVFTVIPFAHLHVHETAAAQVETVPGGAG